MAKSRPVTIQEIELAASDLREIQRGKEFLSELSRVVRPFSKLDIVYRDRARVLLHAMIEAEWLGTLQQITKP